MVSAEANVPKKLVAVGHRVIGQKYIYKKGMIGTWDGRQLRCEHNRRRDRYAILTRSLS